MKYINTMNNYWTEDLEALQKDTRRKIFCIQIPLNYLYSLQAYWARIPHGLQNPLHYLFILGLPGVKSGVYCNCNVFH